MAGEKTEKATPHKRGEERRKGNVFQSRDVVLVFTLLVMIYSLKYFASGIMNVIQRSVRSFFEQAAILDVLAPADVITIGMEAAITIAIAAFPLLLISIAAAVTATAVQTRMLVTFSNIGFKFEKLNPIKGLKNMVSLRSLVELAKNILKFAVLAVVTYFAIRDNFNALPSLMDTDITQGTIFFADTVMTLVTTLCIIFIGLAVLDYFYQRYDYEKKLRMSKDDIKEEYKQTEGDPKIKGKRKQKQMEMAQKRMMQAVSTADVIIRNPTHYAVAISYDAKVNAAPIVVAKGADFLALRIIETAEKNDIVITENRPLARSLYDFVNIDRPIPEKFYTMVAEVLAFVYSIKKKVKGA